MRASWCRATVQRPRLSAVVDVRFGARAGRAACARRRPPPAPWRTCAPRRGLDGKIGERERRLGGRCRGRGGVRGDLGDLARIPSDARTSASLPPSSSSRAVSPTPNGVEQRRRGARVLGDHGARFSAGTNVASKKSRHALSRRRYSPSARARARSREAMAGRKRCVYRKRIVSCAACNPCPYGKVEYSCAACNPCPHGKRKTLRGLQPLPMG